MNNKLKKIIFDLIDTKTKGVDTYHHNGSMWLIFTDQKKWVIEFTKQGTLWYNFNFFQQFFRYLSLDVIENQHYITEWVESILKNGVGYTSPTGEWEPVRVEDTIQNGVRSTIGNSNTQIFFVEDTIQNGVINTVAHPSVFRESKGVQVFFQRHFGGGWSTASGQNKGGQAGKEGNSRHGPK
jgi:hypothetical protein